MTLSKTLKLGFLLSILTTATLFTACTKEDDSETNDKEVNNSEVSEEEAVAIMEASMQSSTGGLNQTTISYSEELTKNIAPNEKCDSLYEETFPYSYKDNLIEANYTVDWSYKITCNRLNIPQSVDFESSSVGNYTTSRIKSDDESTTKAHFSGLEPSSDTLFYNGSFVREGTQEITTNLKTRNLSSTLKIDFTDVEIEKSTSMITSGSGTLTLTGTNGNQTFSFEGSIVFEGDGDATLIVNGNSYEISID